jgi:hypothetical protein
MGKVENIENSAGLAESLQRMVNKRAYELAQGEYQRLRRLLSADLAAGRVRLDGIEGWRPVASPQAPSINALDDLPL